MDPLESLHHQRCDPSSSSGPLPRNLATNPTLLTPPAHQISPPVPQLQPPPSQPPKKPPAAASTTEPPPPRNASVTTKTSSSLSTTTKSANVSMITSLDRPPSPTASQAATTAPQRNAWASSAPKINAAPSQTARTTTPRKPRTIPHPWVPRLQHSSPPSTA